MELKKRIIKYLAKRNIIKYSGRVMTDIPKSVQIEVRSYCPHFVQKPSFSRCDMFLEHRACNPTSMCSMLLLRKSKVRISDENLKLFRQLQD